MLRTGLSVFEKHVFEYVYDIRYWVLGVVLQFVALFFVVRSKFDGSCVNL